MTCIFLIYKIFKPFSYNIDVSLFLGSQDMCVRNFTKLFKVPSLRTIRIIWLSNCSLIAINLILLFRLIKHRYKDIKHVLDSVDESFLWYVWIAVLCVTVLNLIKLEFTMRMRRTPAKNLCSCDSCVKGINPLSNLEIVFVDGKILQDVKYLRLNSFIAFPIFYATGIMFSLTSFTEDCSNLNEITCSRKFVFHTIDWLVIFVFGVFAALSILMKTSPHFVIQGLLDTTDNLDDWVIGQCKFIPRAITQHKIVVRGLDDDSCSYSQVIQESGGFRIPPVTYEDLIEWGWNQNVKKRTHRTYTTCTIEDKDRIEDPPPGALVL